MHACFYRFRLCLLYYCFACLLPLAAHAKLTGEIIFSPSADFFGLWTGNMQDRQDARSVFRQKLLIIELSIQKNDRYLIAVVERFIEDDLHLVIDAYLLNRKNWLIKEKNLTRGLFHEVLDAAISEKGDVVFTNRIFNNHPWAPARGIYLFPHRELRQKDPQAEFLKAVEAHHVDWAPNGNVIAFDTADGIFLMDRLTLKISQIIKDGYRPVFSPDGKKLAFLTRARPTRLSILSLRNPQNLKHIADVLPLYFTWSPDGRYIVYTLPAPGLNLTTENYAVPVAGGPPERILEMYDRGVRLFEWTHAANFRTHAIEPTNKLTTLWGKLKQQDLK